MFEDNKQFDEDIFCWRSGSFCGAAILQLVLMIMMNNHSGVFADDYDYEDFNDDEDKVFLAVWQFLWSGDTAASVPSFMCLRRCATAICYEMMWRIGPKGG